MYKRNIAVTGPNKQVNAVVGRLIAERLEMHFLDTDEYIEYEADMNAAYIVSDYGAEFYYRLETDKLESLHMYDNTVIATSGTAVMTEKNIEILQKFSYIVLLSAREDVVLERIKEDPTMVLKGDIIKRKKEFFRNINVGARMLADVYVDTTGVPPAEVAEEALVQFAELFNDEV